MRKEQDLRKWSGTEQYSGVYRGIVEYVNDPLQQNRVKVRVPFLHFSNETVPTKNLPWAVIAAPFGGGGGFGFSAVPPVGSTVFVMFEQGNSSYPVVIGTWFAVAPEAEAMGRIDKLPKGKVSMSPGEDTPWHSKAGVEIPEDAQRRANQNPENYVLKSPKGHTIVMEDRDEAEYMAMVDRAGQSILFEAEVLEGPNQDNAARRGLQRADENQLFETGKLLGEGARVEITDAAGNTIRLRAKKDTERISIISKTPSQSIRMDLDAADGVLDIVGESDAGQTKIGMDAVSGFAFMRSSSGNELRVDSHGGVSLKSDVISIDGDVSVAGAISASGAISSASSAGGTPGSFNPVSMPLPPTPPLPPAPDVQLGDVITERFTLDDSVNKQGRAIMLDYGILAPATEALAQTAPIIVARNGVTQFFDPKDAMFTDNLGNIWDTQGLLFAPPSNTGSGLGVLGQYYNLPELTELILARTDSTIDLNVGIGVSPAPGVTDDDLWSVRWSGQIKPRYSETYIFYVTSAERVTLTINGTLLIDIDNFGILTTNSAIFDASGNQFYNLEVTFRTSGAIAHQCTLEWQSTTQARQVVPSSRLYSVTGFEALVPDRTYGFSTQDGWLGIGDAFIGLTPTYNDLQIGRIDADPDNFGYTGEPDAVGQIGNGLIDCTKVARGLGNSSGILLSLELTCNPDSSVGPTWTLVLRNAVTFALISSSNATFISDWILQHPTTFYLGDVEYYYQTFISPDPDGTFWISLEATPPDEMPLFNVSPVDASLITMQTLPVQTRTVSAMRLLQIASKTQYFTPGLNSIKLNQILTDDEYLDVTYVTTGQVIAGRSGTETTDIVSRFDFIGDSAQQPMLPAPPTAGTIPVVYRNGVLQRQGASNDYTISLDGKTFVMTPIPFTGDLISILFIKQVPGA